MHKRKTQTKNKPWRVIVVGAEDVAQHLRKAGHRVLSLEQLPVLGLGSADAAVVELHGAVNARSANRFRAKLVEPVLIHRRRAERARAFMCIGRTSSGALPLGLFDEALRNAVERTHLLRELDQHQGTDSDGPTELVTLELRQEEFLPRPAGRTVVARAGKVAERA